MQRVEEKFQNWMKDKVEEEEDNWTFIYNNITKIVQLLKWAEVILHCV